MSIEISRKGKVAKDAETFLKNLHKKQKKIARENEEKNLREVTRFDKYITSRQEKIQIEKAESNRIIQNRAAEQKAKTIDNLSKSCSKFSELSGIRLRIDTLKEEIAIYDEKISENEIKVQKYSKPSQDVSSSILSKIKSLEAEIASAESKLNFFQNSERLAKHPNDLTSVSPNAYSFITQNHPKPDIIMNTPSDA